MKCSSCQYDNPEEALFCAECGKSMEFHCPSCGAVTQATGKFCIKCGQNLQESKKSDPVDYSEPQSYTPKFLADKILTTRSSVEGERKLVTVFFADVANFTSLSEKLDPEEVHQIMDGTFKILMDEIHGHEGTINQFTGDGVMALFGAPVAHEDHAQRSCHAALAIQTAMEPYGEKIKKECNVDLAMRIGLNTGHVIVGSIGDNLRMDYTAVGDATNLAARMESLAIPGSVLISENVQKVVKEYFELENLGKFDIKGKNEPQNVYRLIKASKVETRLDASAVKGLTQFVGRKQSYGTLQDILEKVNSGTGHVVGIVGEAGVGKSRLVLEFQNQLQQEHYTYLEGRCLHFGGAMTYLPFLDIVKSYFGIMDDDREFIIKKKIQDKILGFDQTLTKAIPAFHDLLSLSIDDDVYKKLDPPIKRERAFEAIRDIFLFESQKKALILVVEDLHWIDKTSEDVINYLIDWLPNSPVMLILQYRPEYTHQWGSKSYYTKIGLDQLGTESSGKLVEAILNGDVIPELRELILNRAAGNPLFMEELTHSLLENGSIKRENNQYVLKGSPENIQVPETIQGIISARMDRLEDNLKRTMQVASVIGRDFAFRILNTITDMREDLKSYLLNLQGLEFIYEKRLFPELEYIFKHALIQEVAYNSLLQNRRKEIHEKIGLAIEEIYSDRIEEFYGMLAYHYSKSNNFNKGAKYSKLAAKKAYREAALPEAITFAIQNVNCIEELPQTVENQKALIDARTYLGFYYSVPNYHIEAKKAVDPIIDLAIKFNYKERLTHIYIILGTYHLYIQNSYSEGVKYLEQAVKISKEIKDFVIYPNACMNLGNAYSLNCDFENSKAWYDNGLKFCQDIKSQWGVINLKTHSIYFVHYPKGDIDTAFKESYDTLKGADKTNNVFEKAAAYWGYGMACYGKGFLEEAEEYYKKAVENIERTILLSYAAIFSFGLAEVYTEMQKYNKSKLYYERALKYCKQISFVPCFANLIEISVLRSKLMKDEKIIPQELQCLNVKGNTFKYFEGSIHRRTAEVYGKINQSHFQEADNSIKKAIEADKKNNMRFSLARDYAIYAKLLKQKGDNPKTHEYLNKAVKTFKECGAEGWVEKYEKKLTDL